MRFKLIFIFLIANICFGFDENETIELEQFLNARSAGNFLKTAQNVKYILPPGTLGKIQSIKKFADSPFGSGNLGLQVELMNPPHQGESVWVYYKNSDPGLKLYTTEEAARAHPLASPLVKPLAETPPPTIEDAKIAKTTREQVAIHEVATPYASVVEHIDQMNSMVRNFGSVAAPCIDCNIVTPALRPKNIVLPGLNIAKHFQDLPILIPPKTAVNATGPATEICQYGKLNGVGFCTSEGDSKASQFHFENNGPNHVVPTARAPGREAPGRVWTFEYPSQARQDLGLSVFDAAKGNAKDSAHWESYMMVFPRKTLPSIRTEGSHQIVTIPTGETITFDQKSHTVIGGVMSEDGQVPRPGEGIHPPKVSYHGSGVLIRVDRISDKSLLPQQQNKIAIITKGGKTCKVSTADLWPDRSNISALHFKFPSDENFNLYLKTHCQFSL